LKLAWANSSVKPYLKNPSPKIGLVKWLKVKVLSSSPSTAKKKECVQYHKKIEWEWRKREGDENIKEPGASGSCLYCRLMPQY
jgi:hypothetical protein